MLKTVFINIFKISLAGGLISWLVTSGKLDFKLLKHLLSTPYSVIIAGSLSILNFCLISLRWREILRARSETHLPLAGMMKITWIGQFFSSVLPGSVSGDLIKMLYVQHFDPKFSKKFILISILLDRVMGLCGLILLVGLSSLIFSSYLLKASPDLEPLLITNYSISILVLITLISFYFFNRHLRTILKKIQTRYHHLIWKKIIDLWDDLTAIKSKIIATILISIGVQFIGVVIFWMLIKDHVIGLMDFIQALAFIPIGLMTLALPVAPSGLGVGHAIFQKLFQLCGISNGASLFNIYFFVTLIINIFGFIPYLLSKRIKPTKKTN